MHIYRWKDFFLILKSQLTDGLKASLGLLKIITEAKKE